VSVREEEWLWGWDPTPGIVSLWAEPDGRAWIWRRDPETRQLWREEARFRSWMLLANLDDLAHLGPALRECRLEERQTPTAEIVSFEELGGPGELRFLVSAEDGRRLAAAVLEGARRRLGRALRHLSELGKSDILLLPPEEQYMVQSGRTYFRGLSFEDLARLQFDLETTGLDPEVDRIFLIALRTPRGEVEILEARAATDGAERELIERLLSRIHELDPDVIENHNLHGFDLPFMARRAERLRLPLSLGRAGKPGLWLRPAARGRSAARSEPAAGTARDGARGEGEAAPRERRRRTRFTVPGRELIDSMDAVLRHDFSARDLPGHGLKAVARHFGVARDEREHIPGRRVYEVYTRDPERVRRYAADDVTEAASIAHLLGGATFALARMAPRRYERLADAGPATGVLDPLLVRAYLRARSALPAHETGDGTLHTGAGLHLFAAGVAERIVKADVASLYPSLMREYKIGPRRDRLNALLTLVARLLELRLAAKAEARTLPSSSAEHYTQLALSAAMKIVINSAYGYLGAVGLTRFSDVHAANEVTRQGREVLALICREISARGLTLLEADTDGVYFAVPDHYAEADERRVVREIAALLPRQVQLEFDGRYAAMLSHEPKNYALKPYDDGPLILRGVAFRSSRAEPFGIEFLRAALERLLSGDVAGVRLEYLEVVRRLRARELATADVCARVRLTKTPDEYLAVRSRRRELPYEAMLESGRERWSVGERVRVYRARGGRPALLRDSETDGEPDDEPARVDPRDYDVEFYAHVLRRNFALRLERGLSARDFDAVFADPQQLSLFPDSLRGARPVLTRLEPTSAELDSPRHRA
jgi:DNA polymerase I